MSAPAKWHLIPSNDFSRVHECDRHTHIQTAHATGPSVGAGSIIAFADVAQWYNNYYNDSDNSNKLFQLTIILNIKQWRETGETKIGF